MSIKVSTPIITSGEKTRVEATVTVQGKPYAIWYESTHLDKVTPLQASNSFLILSLFAGLSTGQDIHTSAPVSPELLRQLDEVQSVFTSWFPQFSKVDILSQTSKEIPHRSAGTGTTFSGGADSYFTLLEHEDEIDYLVNVRGFDVKLDDEKMFKLIGSSLKGIAKHRKKELINVSTNLRELLDDFADWGYHTHAAALASVIHLIAGYVGHIYIPSTYSYSDLFPWGSHPITDRLWGSTYLEFTHTAADYSRFEKIKRIAEDQFALDNLTVCWQRINIAEDVRNCSQCEKCMRTMMALEAIGKLSSQKSFNTTLDIDMISGFIIPSDHDYVFMKENYEYISTLSSTPTRSELLSAIKISLDRYLTDQLKGDIKKNSAYLELILEDKDILNLVLDRLWGRNTKMMLRLGAQYTVKKIFNKIK